MKKVLVFMFLAAVFQPSIPGTHVPDYSQSGYNVQRDSGGVQVQPTIPGTGITDYSRQGYRIEGTSIMPTFPGTSVPSYGIGGFNE